MTRSAEMVHREMLSLVPPGWVWPRGEASLFAALLKPAASVIAELEATASAMLEEIDPRTAELCIGDFERVLGADPCGRDPAIMTLPQRQALAHQRWTGRGGQSIAYYLELAARRGIEITIEETRASQVGAMECGDELVCTPEQFVWRVHVALTNPVIFTTGASTTGELLLAFDLSDIECDIRRAKPAHTEVVFVYEES